MKDQHDCECGGKYTNQNHQQHLSSLKHTTSLLDPSNKILTNQDSFSKTEWSKDQHDCECGGNYSNQNHQRHLSSLKHTKYLHTIDHNTNEYPNHKTSSNSVPIRKPSSIPIPNHKPKRIQKSCIKYDEEEEDNPDNLPSSTTTLNTNFNLNPGEHQDCYIGPPRKRAKSGSINLNPNPNPDPNPNPTPNPNPNNNHIPNPDPNPNISPLINDTIIDLTQDPDYSLHNSSPLLRHPTGEYYFPSSEDDEDAT